MVVALQKQATPATSPMAMAPMGPTNPAAGVMATKPPTAPDTIPSVVGLTCLIHSANIHARAAVALARWVTSMAKAAVPLAPRALPALNPNQPTHSMAAPVTVRLMLCGGIGVVG